MGLLKRLAGTPSEVSLPRESMDIVGESNYQRALNSIAGGKTDDRGGHNIPVTIRLQREPNNPYDKNAVQCLIEGKLVGYINRDDAARLQELLRKCEKRGEKAEVAGHIVGGWKRPGGDEGSYGVKIN